MRVGRGSVGVGAGAMISHGYLILGVFLGFLLGVGAILLAYKLCRMGEIKRKIPDSEDVNASDIIR